MPQFFLSALLCAAILSFMPQTLTASFLCCYKSVSVAPPGSLKDDSSGPSIRPPEKIFTHEKTGQLSDLKKILSDRYSAGGPYAVVFDIDDTCIRFAKKEGSYKPVAIVRDFYHWVASQGWRALFITARWQKAGEAYRTTQLIAARDLCSAGYRNINLENIICRDYQTYQEHSRSPENKASLVGAWKEGQRKNIATERRATIIATLDDKLENLQGTNLGESIHIRYK
jgi:hypothetical protein